MSNVVFASLYIPSVSCGYDYNSLMQQKYKFYIICQCQKHSTTLFVRGILSKTLLQRIDMGLQLLMCYKKKNYFARIVLHHFST